ncbi:MAG: tRNA adenosine(34) deaminase TadA [Thermaerobacter sp.]|nr:tRNA adenosine(34) deaminase TadA [Thermaerobacter sp.]
MHRTFMRSALAQAKAALQDGEVPVGALIVAPDGEVLSAAHNLRESRHDPTAHAEILALRAAGERLGNWRLSGTTLYVTLEPCPMCAAAIVAARVARVVFGAQDPRLGAAGSRLQLFAELEQESPVDVIGGVMEEEASALLRSFFAERR